MKESILGESNLPNGPLAIRKCAKTIAIDGSSYHHALEVAQSGPSVLLGCWWLVWSARRESLVLGVGVFKVCRGCVHVLRCDPLVQNHQDQVHEEVVLVVEFVLLLRAQLQSERLKSNSGGYDMMS